MHLLLRVLTQSIAVLSDKVLVAGLMTAAGLRFRLVQKNEDYISFTALKENVGYHSMIGFRIH
jgi:hypothetical protein